MRKALMDSFRLNQVVTRYRSLLVTMRWLVGIVFVTIGISAGDEPASWSIGKKFQKEIKLPLLVTSSEPMQIRSFLKELGRARHIAILLDRRIDPRRKLTTSISAISFEDGIGELATRIGAGVSRIADTYVIGPSESVGLLRTRVSMLRDDLKESDLTVKRQQEVLQEVLVEWEDLTSPRELVRDLATNYAVSVRNPEQIPHDLWAEGAISHANLIEALSIILSQYEQSFRWVDEKTIEVIAAPEVRFIDKTYQPQRMSAPDAAKLIQQSNPKLQVQIADQKLKVTGRVEDHELVVELLSQKMSPNTVPATSNPNSLVNRRFTLTIEQQPFDGVIEFLNANGIDVKYDANKLTAAGIDLKKRISLKLEQGTIDELMGTICDAMNIEFEITEDSIQLTVRE